MTEKGSNPNTAVVIAAIDVVGTLGAALIGNWDKIFRETRTTSPPAQEPVPREVDQPTSGTGRDDPGGPILPPSTSSDAIKFPGGLDSQPTQPPLVKSPPLAGKCKSDEDRTFVAVADASEVGVFELGEVDAAGAGGEKWIARLDGRDVEIDVYAMPSGSHHTHMTLELSLDGNRMDGLAHAVQVDEPAVPVHFRKLN